MRTQRISRRKGWVIEIILRVSHHSLANRSVHPILPGAVPDDPLKASTLKIRGLPQ
jgi:hypothetical protein